MSTLALTIVFSVATLQAPPPPEPAPSVPPAEAVPGPGEDDTAPSLDDLLGLDEDEDNAAGEAARANEQELQRRLAEGQLGDLFDQALTKMQRSAELLDLEFDAGLGTQRVQEGILFELDQLIDMAKQMSSKMQMSSSSSSSSSPNQQRQQSPGARPQDSSGGQRRAQGPQDGQAIEPPPGQEGEINKLIEETESEWGHLPPRYREMLEQGRNRQASPLYRKLTDAYYKRLAEEGSS